MTTLWFLPSQQPSVLTLPLRYYSASWGSRTMYSYTFGSSLAQQDSRRKSHNQTQQCLLLKQEAYPELHGC